MERNLNKVTFKTDPPGFDIPQSYDLNNLRGSNGMPLTIHPSAYESYEVPYVPTGFKYEPYMERLRKQVEYYADELGVVFKDQGGALPSGQARIGAGELPPEDPNFVDPYEDPDKPEDRPDWE